MAGNRHSGMIVPCSQTCILSSLNADSLEMDDDEANLASYWTVPFTEIRVGMKVRGSIKWIFISQEAISLYNLIAD
jgi:hypothetical protein